jgi:hypothetical protein
MAVPTRTYVIEFAFFFLICIYLFQPVLYHLGIPRGIYRFCTIDPITNLPLKFLIRYLDGTFWSVSEFNSLWILREVRGRYF